MKNIKKWLALLMAGLIMSASLIACDSGSSSDDDDDETTETTETTDAATSTGDGASQGDDATTEEYATLEALYDAMKSADNLTIVLTEAEASATMVYDGNKLMFTVTESGEESNFISDGELMYTEVDGEWYSTADEGTAESASVEYLIELIEELEEKALASENGVYTVTGSYEGETCTAEITFSGIVTIPEDAVSMDELMG